MHGGHALIKSLELGPMQAERMLQPSSPQPSRFLSMQLQGYEFRKNPFDLLAIRGLSLTRKLFSIHKLSYNVVCAFRSRTHITRAFLDLRLCG